MTGARTFKCSGCGALYASLDDLRTSTDERGVTRCFCGAVPDAAARWLAPHRCRDEGERAGCLGVADERYTMRFDDLGAPPIHWCAACGPEAQALNAALEQALATRGEPFAQELETRIDAAEKARRS